MKNKGFLIAGVIVLGVVGIASIFRVPISDFLSRGRSSFGGLGSDSSGAGASGGFVGGVPVEVSSQSVTSVVPQETQSIASQRFMPAVDSLQYTASMTPKIRSIGTQSFIETTNRLSRNPNISLATGGTAEVTLTPMISIKSRQEIVGGLARQNLNLVNTGRTSSPADLVKKGGSGGANMSPFNPATLPKNSILKGV